MTPWPERPDTNHGNRPRDRGAIKRTEDVDNQRVENQEKVKRREARSRRFADLDASVRRRLADG